MKMPIIVSWLPPQGVDPTKSLFSQGEQFSAILTDEHATSSYGQPVVVQHDGQALGPADLPHMAQVLPDVPFTNTEPPRHEINDEQRRLLVAAGEAGYSVCF